MKFLKVFLLLLCITAATDMFACTSLIVTRGATRDGSNIITYAADSHSLYGELYNYPAADHKKGSMRIIRDWDSNAYLGQIPEVEHTYQVMGNMNEFGLTIAESTWGGIELLQKPNGIIDYGSLIYLALQRSKTAREALSVMTSLVEEYGYASSGESFSIGDPNEVWIMELIGKGEFEKGAVWVARKIPDGYISGHANQPRIHKFPQNDPETIYSKDVISFARNHGLYTGSDEDFDFSMTYGVTDFGELRGCDARVWAFFNRYTNYAQRFLPWINEGKGEPMPLWVKPSRKITVDDMKWMMRDHFEGTPFDMTKDSGTGPFYSPYRYRPMTFKVDGVEYTNERAIATQQTGFSFVSQMRKDVPDAMKGILWFGTDDANTCVYLPIFCNITKTPAQLSHGDTNTLNWNANFWVNNYVANQAYCRYSRMIPDIRKVQSKLEDEIAEEVKALEKDTRMTNSKKARKLTQALADKWAEKATTEYKALGDYLFVKHLDGNMKKEDENGFLYDKDGFPSYPTFPGYDNPEYYKSIVRDAGEWLRVKDI